ncbi:hypothetical protein BD413DRAFT_235296 [Trametes elegans]|nr:hypothetical protein BD413DRAFT_235296 [Trametes elegans]
MFVELDVWAVLDDCPTSSPLDAHLSLLVMVFSFSFNLSVPGIANPFAAAAEQAPPPRLHNDTNAHHSSARRRPPSPSLLPPLARKRGWVPSSSEPSCAVPMHTSTSGYLDTPAKYRDMAHESAEQDEVEEMVAETMWGDIDLITHSAWMIRSWRNPRHNAAGLQRDTRTTPLVPCAMRASV